MQLSQLKTHLEDLQAKYTENHPDILVTKKKIFDIEKKIAESAASAPGMDSVKKGKTGDPVQEQYNIFQAERKTQLAMLDKEIARLKKEDEKARSMITAYRTGSKMRL